MGAPEGVASGVMRGVGHRITRRSSETLASQLPDGEGATLKMAPAWPLSRQRGGRRSTGDGAVALALLATRQLQSKQSTVRKADPAIASQRPGVGRCACSAIAYSKGVSVHPMAQLLDEALASAN